MMVALRTHFQIIVELLLVDQFTALAAFHPYIVGDLRRLTDVAGGEALSVTPKKFFHLGSTFRVVAAFDRFVLYITVAVFSIITSFASVGRVAR
jgi:hypothetical protein